MNNNRRRLARGFTLLELLVVLMIVALLLAMVGFSFRAPYQAARLQGAVEQWQVWDRQLRDHAVAHQAATEMMIDLERQQTVATERDRRSDERTLLLGSGVVIERIVTERMWSSGKVTISVSPVGQTPSYAVRLRGAKGTSRWLIFAGVTGECLELADDGEVTRLFALLAKDKA